MYSLALHGRRVVDLQKWRHHLRVPMKLVQNASAFSNSFSSASGADVSPKDCRKGQIFTISYLVDSLGLNAKLAESISRKVSFVNKGKPDSVLNLLRRYGFTDSQISTIITNYPQLLMLDAKKSLGPKLEFLQSRGGSSSEFTDIVTNVPKLLRKNGDKSISVYYDFLKDTLHDKSSKWETSSQSLPQQENKVRNVLILRKQGMPQRMLLPLLNSHFGPLYGKEIFEASLKKVNKMRFNPTSFMFLQALRVLYKSDKTIQERVSVYRKLGITVKKTWEIFKTYPGFLTHSEKKILKSVETFESLGISKEEFVKMVKRYPQCVGLDAESVEKKTKFLLKIWRLRAVVLLPQLLGLSMEKTIVPRCNVVDALMSKGLLEPRRTRISSVLLCSDQKFLNSYVKKHDDKQLVDELMDIFNGDREMTSSWWMS